MNTAVAAEVIPTVPGTPFAGGLYFDRIVVAGTLYALVSAGIDFVGQVIRPWHRTLRRRTFRSAVERCRTQPAAELYETANSYFGLLRQAGRSHVDRAALANVLRARGHSVDRPLTKTYRRRSTA